MDSVLRPLGFDRQEFVWNRQRAGLVDVVDIQISESTSTFTINLGVLDPLVHKALWNTDPRDFVEEATCTIRSRLGQLADGKDRWWTSSDTDAIEQVRELLIAHGIPFLEGATSRAELVDLCRGSLGGSRGPGCPPYRGPIHEYG